MLNLEFSSSCNTHFGRTENDNNNAAKHPFVSVEELEHTLSLSQLWVKDDDTY